MRVHIWVLAALVLVGMAGIACADDIGKTIFGDGWYMEYTDVESSPRTVLTTINTTNDDPDTWQFASSVIVTEGQEYAIHFVSTINFHQWQDNNVPFAVGYPGTFVRFENGADAEDEGYTIFKVLF